MIFRKTVDSKPKNKITVSFNKIKTFFKYIFENNSDIPPDFFLKCFLRYFVNSLYPSGRFKISNLSIFVSIRIKIS